MKRLLIALALGAFVATPAMADLYSFTYGDLTSTGSTTLFTADVLDGTTVGDVTRESPVQNAHFDSDWSEVGESADFTLSMTISGVDVTGKLAHGVGSLVAIDVDGDTITANLEGNWTLPVFVGTISNALYNPTGAGGGTFDGDTGFANLIFNGSPGPFPGVIIELTSSGLNFNSGWSSDVSAGVTGFVTPVPAAALLGLLGLGVAGLKLRKSV